MVDDFPVIILDDHAIFDSSLFSTLSLLSYYRMGQAGALKWADKEVIRASGLGVEDMNQDELTEMLEGEGEEVGFEFAASQSLTNMEDADSTMLSADDDPESFELVEDIGTELGPTQDDVGGRKKVFQPLFED
ncbi:hypothetical protein EV424DRAFT_1590443 [Suillus variegatus]|nr:hypothetical protein EV424DRAFT_1590443 [Suillus variegatus]